MTAPQELARAQEAARALERWVALLGERYGDCIGVRRLRNDMRRVVEDLGELGDPPPVHSDVPILYEVVPDAEYTWQMWQSAEDDGLGSAR